MTIDQKKDLIFHSDILLGDVVKAWREVRGLSVTELAARAGSPIGKGYISEVENNKIRTPNDEYLIRIAKALDIPVEYLVLRRLPDEQLVRADRNEKKSVGVFSSPLPSPRLENNASKLKDNEEEELEQILIELEDLRKRVKKLLTDKRNKKSLMKGN